MNTNLTQLITTLKQANPMPHYLASLANIRIPRIGSAIHAPAFIRPGDTHPSFAVYENGCFDFATATYYDIFSLTQKALNMSFIEAVEHINGQPIYSSKQRTEFTLIQSEAQKTLDRKIDFWHSELLNNTEMLDYLHSRNISDDTIKRFKLGWSKNRGRIMFPFSTGKRWCYFSGRDMVGSGPKYQKASLTPTADNTEAECYENVPWGLQTIHHNSARKEEYTGIDGETYTIDAQDPRDDTLCLTEGHLDALSLAQDDWQVLATGGGHIGQYFMSSFLDIARTYKQVALFFDNDNAGSKFQLDMARRLFDAKIPFVCGHIPQKVNGSNVKDINDYYCAGGDLAQLVITATPGLVELAKFTRTLDELANLFVRAAQWLPSYKLFELKEACCSLADPDTGVKKYSGKMINHLYAMATMALPEMTVAQKVNDKHTLLFDTAGIFYEYTRGIWEQVSDFEIQRYVGEALGMRASSGRMRSVTNYLKAEHSGANLFNRKNVLVLKNGTIHLDEVVQDLAGAFKPHSPEDLSTQLVPCMYDPDADAPRWKKYVHDVCGGDPSKKRLMQQMAGYVMCPDNRYQKFFYLLGDGSNGKSIFMNVLEAVYGTENCSSVQPSRLGSQFDPIALKDSLANFCYEAKSILNGSEEALKAVVSGDPIMAAHKGVDAVKFSTRAKIFIAANKCFASDDVSLGFLRRIIFFKFDKQFLGSDANKNLFKELMQELPGIFNWCLQGYIDLVQSGGFQELEEQAAVIDDLMTQMSPTSLFIREVFPALGGRMMNDRELYSAYKTWCEDGGFKRLNRIEFMKDIMLLIRQKKSSLEVKVTHNNEGKRLFILPGHSEDEDSRENGPADETAGEAGDVIALGEPAAQTSADTQETRAQDETPRDEETRADAEDAGQVREAEQDGTAQVRSDSPVAGPVGSSHMHVRHGEESTNSPNVQDNGARTQEAPKQSKLTEAQIKSLNTYTFGNTEIGVRRLHEYYLQATKTELLEALTLGDWITLKEFYKTDAEARNAMKMMWGIRTFKSVYDEYEQKLMDKLAQKGENNNE